MGSLGRLGALLGLILIISADGNSQGVSIQPHYHRGLPPDRCRVRMDGILATVPWNATSVPQDIPALILLQHPWCVLPAPSALVVLQLARIAKPVKTAPQTMLHQHCQKGNTVASLLKFTQ